MEYNALIITPDARLAVQEQRAALSRIGQSVAAGNRYISYAQFLNLLLRSSELLQDTHLLTAAERQLLLQIILEDKRLGWPSFFRRTTLSASLARLIAECKAVELYPEELAARLAKATEVMPSPELVEPLIATYRQYQQELRRKRCHDREDVGLAVLQLLRQESPARVLRDSFAGDGAQLHFVQLCHFRRLDPLQKSIVQALAADTALEITVLPLHSADDTRLSALQRLIQNGEAPTEHSQGKANIYLMQAEDPRVECREIVRQIKDALLQGRKSSSCAVLATEDAAYQEHLQREFKEQNVPFDLLQRVRLSDEPLSRALLQLVAAAGNPHELPLPALLREPLLNPIVPNKLNISLRIAEQWPLIGSVASLDRWLERWERIGERLKATESSRRSSGTTVGELSSDEYRAGSAYLLGWQKRLRAIAEAGSVSELCARLLQITRLELNWPLRAMPRGLAADEALQTRRRIEAVWEALVETLRSLGQHLPHNVSRSQMLPGFTEALKLMLQNTWLQLPLGQQGGVTVLNAEELNGRSFEMLAVPGCVSERFPEEPPGDWLLGDTVRLNLGLPTAHDFAEEQRELFSGVLGSAEKELLFTWPQFSERGTAKQRSGFVNQLALQSAAYIHSGNYPRRVTAETVTSVAELRRVLLVTPKSEDLLLQNSLNDLLWTEGDQESWESVRKMMHIAATRQNQDAFMQPLEQEYAAELGAVLRERMRQFQYSASSLQAYSDCPYRFMVERLLGLGEMSETRDNLQPQERGALYHQIVQELLAPVCPQDKPLFELPQEKWPERLEELLEEFWRRPTGLRMSSNLWRLEQRQARQVLTRWLERERLQAKAPNLACEWSFGGNTGLREICPRAEDCEQAAYDATGRLICARPRHRPGALRLEHQGENLLLGGIIDRVDLLPQGALLIDYKSGSSAGHSRSAIAEMRDIQLPLYALAWNQNEPERQAAAIAYVFLGASDEGKMWQTHYLDEPLQNRKEKLSLTWDEYRKRLVEHCFDIDRGIRSGQFTARPLEAKVCDWCPMNGLCPRVGAKQEEEGDEDNGAEA